MPEHHEHIRAQVTAPTAQPAPLEKHPEEVDPLGKNHQAHHHEKISPEEKRIIDILLIAIIATIIFIPIIAAVSESPIINVFIGISALLATLIIDFVLTKQHYKVVTFWIVLICTHILAMAVIYGANFILADKINLAGSISTSTVLAIIVTAIIMLVDAKRVKKSMELKHTVEFKPEKISEYVHSIEDKAKALNFAIGRVYKTSNGGTAVMRERLKIPAEWYNEFNLYKDEDLKTQLDNAGILVRKIRDRLSLYTKPEHEVFTKTEFSGLKNIVRNKEGNDAIIDVLKTNDKDPVEHYYVAACDFCDRILEEVERENKI
jgi:antitoxin component of MazEF toxin-antitoxin module/uncharacterized membrane protein YhaH (DUF805 family)